MAEKKKTEKEVVFKANVKLGEEFHSVGDKVKLSEEDYEACVAAGVVEE